MKMLGENPTEEILLELVNKFDEDGNGTIEFSEFLVMMTTKDSIENQHYISITMSLMQAKEADIEESENFIPCCFRALRDRNGRTLKVLNTTQNFTETFIFTGIINISGSFEVCNAKSAKRSSHDKKW